MSFLHDYMLASSGNEVPVVYHRWCGLSTLSHLISRRVWVDQGHFRIYPSMYILLTGPPGVKKSTAMSISRRLVRELKTIPINPPSITKEALTEMMGEKDSPCRKNFKATVDGKPKLLNYTHMSLFCNEFLTLISAGSNQTGMIEFLTDIWGEDAFEVKTKGRGHDIIEGPYVTMLGCLTTQSLKALISTKIISAGFHRRAMFVYSNDVGNPVPFVEVTDEQKSAWDRLLQHARKLQLVSGAFTWTPEGREFYAHWYNTINHQAKINCDSEVRLGFLQSKPEYVLKVAMLVTLSDSESLELTKERLELALAFIDEIEPRMGLIFEGAGRNELSPIAAQIKEMVQTNSEPILETRLHKVFWNEVDTDELNKILDHLVYIGEVKRFTVTTDTRPLKLVSRPDYALADAQRVPLPGDEASRGSET